MANLNAVAGWDAVPQLEKTDIIIAGPGGRANAQAQALLNRLEWLCRQTVNVRDPRFAGGAKADGSDDSAAIQAAIDSLLPAGGMVRIPAGQYSTSKTIRSYTNIILDGDGKLATQFRKINNSADTYGAVKSLTGPDDNYSVDAIVSVIHPDQEYAYYWAIRGIGLFGASSSPAEYGIFAPRNSRFDVSDVYVNNATHQFYTHDSWMGIIRNTTFDGCDYGVSWANDGSGNSTGDGITFDNVWVANVRKRGFDLFGLNYSSFHNIGCDHYNQGATGALSDVNAADNMAAAYSFTSCVGINIGGMGAEEIHGTVMASLNSRINITGLKTFDQFGYTSEGSLPATLMVDGGAVSIKSSYFAPTGTPGNFYDFARQNGARLNIEQTVLPSGGNTFASYSGGASMLTLDGGEVSVYSANSKNIPLRLDRGLIVRRFKRAPFANGTEILEQIPVGATLRRVRVCMTAKATQFTGLQVGHQNNGSAYIIFDASAQGINQWVEYVPTPGSDASPDGSSWQLSVTTTAGSAYGCAGVVEVEYFIP